MVAGLLAAAVVFVAVSLAVRTKGSVEPELALVTGNDGSGNVIVTGKDEKGRLSQLMVIAPEGREGYSIYTIPVRTLAETAGDGFQQMDAAIETGGQELLDQTVADLLQIPIQYHLSFRTTAVEAAAGQTGSINFRTERPLALTTESGPVILSAGDNPAGSRLALTYLNSSLSDNRDGPQVQALFYSGLLEALAAKPDPDRRSFAQQLLKQLETDMDDEQFTGLFMALTAPGRKVGVWPLPVKSAGSGAGWYFEPVPDQIYSLMTGSQMDTNINLAVQNGTGAGGVVEAAGKRLAPLRYNLNLMTDPSGVNYDFTQIRTGVDAVNEGNRVRDLLGKGTLIKDEYLEKRQITVIIGKDLSVAELERR